MDAREQALALLGNGNDPSVVAGCLGVSPGFISQLLADEAFAKQVAALRFVNLQASTARDGKYDKLEDLFIGRLEEVAPFMNKPREVLMAMTVLNNAKRRGAKVEATPADVGAKTVVNITMPVALIKHFSIDARQTVIRIGDQDLTTINAQGLSALQKRALAPPAPKVLENSGDSNEESNGNGSSQAVATS